jgi:AcrR family transcriptional regulator
MATPTGTDDGLGLRERNKIDKRNRIKEAVRALIAQKGYDEMTTREIAGRAGVGLGTLFSYATNKRDLLFLVYNDDTDELLDAADEPAGDASYLDRLVGVFRPFYEHFAGDPVFARYLLRELLFYETGSEAARFQDGRRGIVDRVERATVAAQADGAIGSREPSRTIARLIFAVYQAEIRRWLMEKVPEPEAGLDRLRHVLGLVISGLDPREGAA